MDEELESLQIIYHHHDDCVDKCSHAPPEPSHISLQLEQKRKLTIWCAVVGPHWSCALAPHHNSWSSEVEGPRQSPSIQNIHIHHIFSPESIVVPDSVERDRLLKWQSGKSNPGQLQSAGWEGYWNLRRWRDTALYCCSTHILYLMHISNFCQCMPDDSNNLWIVISLG